MENEENRGLINKKASKEWLERLFQCYGELSYILSLSHTLGHLEYSWSTIGECGILGYLEKEGKGRAGKHKRTSRS